MGITLRQLQYPPRWLQPLRQYSPEAWLFLSDARWDDMLRAGGLDAVKECTRLGQPTLYGECRRGYSCASPEGCG